MGSGAQDVFNKKGRQSVSVPTPDNTARRGEREGGGEEREKDRQAAFAWAVTRVDPRGRRVLPPKRVQVAEW